MNELEKAIFDELKAAVSFQDFFNKISVLQLSFNKFELKSLCKVVKYDSFVEKYGFQTLCYITDNIHKERALFNKVPEKVRIRELLSEFEKDEE
nr:hypothetical protein [uncultured Trichococcus sp.]